MIESVVVILVVIAAYYISGFIFFGEHVETSEVVEHGMVMDTEKDELVSVSRVWIVSDVTVYDRLTGTTIRKYTVKKPKV